MRGKCVEVRLAPAVTGDRPGNARDDIEFDQVSLTPAALPAIARQESIHCAAIGPNGLA